MSITNDVSYKIQNLLNQDYNIQHIDLEYQTITDFNPLLSILAKFNSLISLNLQGNRLKTLPQDLSMLKNVRKINISNNLLQQNIEHTLQALNTLPCLKQLIFRLSSKQLQKYVIKSLPYLQCYNQHNIKQNLQNHRTNHELQKSTQQIIQWYQQLLQLKKQYLAINADSDEVQEFKQQIERFMNGTTNNRLTYTSIFALFRDRVLQLCSDIYGDIGIYLKKVWLGGQMLMQRYHLNQEQSINYPIDRNRETELLKKQIMRMREWQAIRTKEINQLELENQKVMEQLYQYTMQYKQKSQKEVYHSKVMNSNLESSISTVGNYHPNRNLTLKQLKQHIEELYEAKLKLDQKNSHGKLAYETMEQFLYSYLSQKYGLKTLTIDNVNAILTAVEQYSSQDNDVAVFGKILKNQIDEEFKFVQVELKSTVHDLLKMHIKSKLPLKRANQLQELIDYKCMNEITLEQIEDIIKYLYNQQDSTVILQKVHQIIKNTPKKVELSKQQRRRNRYQNNTNNTLSIKFTQFLQCVLQFQMYNHKKYLQPLVTLFKELDIDNDGIINEEQFISIVEKLCQESNEFLPQLLQIVDPENHKVVTFTQMVRLLANHPINNPILSRQQNKKC